MIDINSRHLSPEYKQYLQSPKWEQIRQRVFARDGFKCIICGAKENLHCHHHRTTHLFHEENHLEDLVTLCEKHHDDLHLYYNFCDNLKAYYEQRRHEENKAKGYY